MATQSAEFCWLAGRPAAVGSMMLQNSLELTINDAICEWNQSGPVPSLSTEQISTVAKEKETSSQGPKVALHRATCTSSSPVHLSRLVEDPSRYRLEDLRGCYVEFSRDQYGSRFLQREMEVAGSAVIQLVFEEVLPVISNLILDAYGNYVVQKFFDFGTECHKMILVSKLQGHVFLLSTHTYGCRVIQKALENVPSYYQAQILVELQRQVLDCIKDQHGNHVIQKCFTSLPPYLLQGMVDAIQKNSVEVAIHPFGCRVMQRLMESCSEHQREQVWMELFQSAGHLMQHQYGNYIIQHVLDYGSSLYKSQIISSVKGKVFLYALQKYASNVLEKCLVHGSPAEVTDIIAELCQHDCNILSMMKDQYANYVIQRALDVAQPNQKKQIIYKIMPLLESARKYMYAKHIVSKVEGHLTGTQVAFHSKHGFMPPRRPSLGRTTAQADNKEQGY